MQHLAASIHFESRVVELAHDVEDIVELAQHVLTVEQDHRRRCRRSLNLEKPEIHRNDESSE